MKYMIFLILLVVAYPVNASSSYPSTLDDGQAYDFYTCKVDCNEKFDSFQAAHDSLESWLKGAYGSGTYLDYNSHDSDYLVYDMRYENGNLVNAPNYGPSIKWSGYDASDDPADGDASGPDVDDFDAECEAIKPDFISLPDDLAPVDESFTWESQGCEFSTSSLWIQEPSGDWSARVQTAEALEVEPPAEEIAPPEDGEDSTGDYVETSDPDTDCPWSNVSYDGQDYCYVGDDADIGDEYADGSSRVDHWDGSYTVTDSDGNSQTYNSDGEPTDTASTAPGSGPGAYNSGCPDWICSDDGIEGGDALGDAPDLPVETSDFGDDQVSWDSGLSSDASCPEPQSVPIAFAGFSTDLEFSYQGFCDFASVIRALVLAAAYMSAAFLVYRGVTS